jgi:glutamine synthetase adenylyltransferase
LLSSAAAQAMDRKDSCVDYAWDKVKEYYGEKRYLTAYGYARAASVCASTTQFREQKESEEFREHVHNVLNKLRTSAKTGKPIPLGISAGGNPKLFWDVPD